MKTYVEDGTLIPLVILISCSQGRTKGQELRKRTTHRCRHIQYGQSRANYKKASMIT